MIRYAIKNVAGEVLAIHGRRDGPNGKEMPWYHPDGRLSRGEIKPGELPLFGTEFVPKWDIDQPVIVTEGEKAAAALIEAGFQAVGTFGASHTPNRESLMILAGLPVLLWPDFDSAGVGHMLRRARELREIAASVAWIAVDGAEPGDDAADAFEAGGRDLIAELVAIATPRPPRTLMNLIKVAPRRVAARPRAARSRTPWRQVSIAPRSEIVPLARAVRSAERGNRNAMLLWAASRANDNGLGRDVAEDALLDAFMADEPTPDREREGRRTIASAYRR